MGEIGVIFWYYILQAISESLPGRTVDHNGSGQAG